MRNSPYIPWGLVFLVYVTVCVSFASTLEIDVHRDRSVQLLLRLDHPANGGQKEKIRLVSHTINRCFPGRISTRVISREEGNLYDGILMNVRDVDILMDTTNFVDFSYRRSFYKEKYYLKLLFNRGVFDSRFFTILKQENINPAVFKNILDRGEYLNVRVRLPGRCTETNMTEKNGEYYYTVYWDGKRSSGQYLLLTSYRFFPEIYLTVLLIILILAVWVAMTIYRKYVRHSGA